MMRTRKLLGYFIHFAFATQLVAQAQFQLLPPKTLQERLDLYKGNDSTREAALLILFRNAGCNPTHITEQQVPTRKEPNLICVVPGETQRTIVIGAHFDHVSEGSGIVDNWSGASLLPSLLQSVSGTKHHHTFVFIGFTGEESGQLGSAFYVNHLRKDEIEQISLMVTLDTLGLGPTKVWASRSDKAAVSLLAGTAAFFQLPLAGMNVDGFGQSDEEAFIQKKVKTITIHSLTPANGNVLHSPRDTPAAIKFSDYYDTYHLLAGYLMVLDERLDPGQAKAATESR